MINDAKIGEKCGLCYARDFSPYAWACAIGMIIQKQLPDWSFLLFFLLILPMMAPFMSDLHWQKDNEVKP